MLLHKREFKAMNLSKLEKKIFMISFRYLDPVYQQCLTVGTISSELS